MGISIAEDVALFQQIRDKVAEAVVPACQAIGETYKDHLVDYTLIESGAHGPATAAGYPPSAPEGRPPMKMTGHLRDSVFMIPASGGGGFATCSVSPDTIYASTIHWGGVHTGKPLMWLWVRYVGPATVKKMNWRKHVVDIGSRPYMIIAVDETFANGSLSRAAAMAFEVAVWG